MDLSQLPRILLRWWWLIVALALAAGGVAFLVSQVLPKQYEAEARILVGSLTEADYDQLLAYQQLAQTYAGLATTTPVLSRVAERLDLSDDAPRLAARIDVRAPAGQSFVRIVATAATRQESSQLANAVAEEIATLARPAIDEPSLVTIVQPALPPDSPSSPRVVLNMAVAVALGLGLGVIVALLMGGPATTSTTDFDRRRPSGP